MTAKCFPAFEAHRLDDPSHNVRLPCPGSQALGAEGKVFAVDAQFKILALLWRKLDHSSQSGVELIHAETESEAMNRSLSKGFHRGTLVNVGKDSPLVQGVKLA